MMKRNAKPAILAAIIVSSLFLSCNMGDLSLSVDVDLQDPLSLAISPSASTLYSYDTLTLTAAADRAPDGWKWYLDGKLLPYGTASISIGPDLDVGTHCATVIATKGVVTGSADCRFEVRPCMGIDEDFDDGIPQGWALNPLSWQIVDGRLTNIWSQTNTWQNTYFSAKRFNGAFTYQADSRVVSGPAAWAKGLFIQNANPLLAGKSISIGFMLSGTSSNYLYWVGRIGDDMNPDVWTGWREYNSAAETITMKIVTDGAGNNYCYLNDDLVYVWNDTSVLTGYVGMSYYDGLDFGSFVYTFDNVKLTLNDNDYVYPVLESARQVKPLPADAAAMRAFR